MFVEAVRNASDVDRARITVCGGHFDVASVGVFGSISATSDPFLAVRIRLLSGSLSDFDGVVA